MDVVLVAPEIATNTGNIIRLCANTGARLHLVEPLGFSLDDRLLRRAGLDYHELTDLRVHADVHACAEALKGRRRFAFSSRATTRYDTVAYEPDDVFVFGAERAGLQPEQLMALDPLTMLTIPMRPDNRSLNLANSVAVITYEAWRQQGFAGSAEAPQRPPGLTSETLLSEPFDV